MIMIASAFFGLSVGFYIINAVSTKENASTTLPAICVFAMLIFIVFILILQHLNNKSDKKKAELEKKQIDSTTTNPKEQ